MRIVKKYPPNWNEIKNSSLDPDENTVFCFGETLYNPSGKEIFEDILEHELVHQKQQSLYATPEMWWMKYLYNKDFRLQEEIMAFQAQYRWVKARVPNSAAKQCLFDLADILSGTMYNLEIHHMDAEQMIRRK